MKKIVVLTLMSFVFYSHAMEQGQSRYKRKRSEINERLEESPEDNYLSIITEIKRTKTKKTIEKMIKAADVIEENLSTFAPEHRTLFFDLLSVHLRNIAQRNQKMAKSFSQDFLDSIHPQSENDLSDDDVINIQLHQVPAITEEQLYSQAMQGGDQ